MKKVAVLFLITSILYSCNSNTENTNGQENADTILALPETTSSADTAKSEPVNMEEGMMIMFGGKMMINRNMKTEPMTEPVMCTDGCKVNPNGEVVMKNGTSMMMKEGDIIDKDGNMIHPTGRVVDVSDSM